MKKLNLFLFASMVCCFGALTTGCGGGSAENSVSEAPATEISQEEIDAQATTYADEADEMRKRDAQYK